MADALADLYANREQGYSTDAVKEYLKGIDPAEIRAYASRVHALGQKVDDAVASLTQLQATVATAVKAARSAIGAAAEQRHMAATYLFDMVNTNKTIGAADARMLLGEARLLLDDALKKNPAYWEAVVYKSLVVRSQARYETDPAVVKTLTAEADRLLAQAEAMRKK